MTWWTSAAWWALSLLYLVCSLLVGYGAVRVARQPARWIGRHRR